MANRKRGAQPAAKEQPGNLNALKHGFYSRSFLDLENTDLEAMLAQDLDSEIAMLRVVVRRAFELSTAPAAGGLDTDDQERRPTRPASAGQDLDRAIHVMNSLGMASIRLGSLLKIQAMLGKREGDIGATISEALKEVARELKL